MGCASFFSNYFSQTHAVRERKAKGLHPVDEMGRFYILVACFFCSICVSIVNAFDLFTTQFQEQFGLSDGDLSTVSTVGLVFCYFTIPYSFIYEYLGPFLLYWICLLTSVIGALCLGLTFDGKIKGNTATITVFYAMLNTASGLIDTAYISTLSEIFPRNRGPVVCLAKVMTGLGSSILACMSANIFIDSISGFIYFLMALNLVVSSWASFVIVLPPYYMNWWRRRGKSAEEVAELTALQPYFDLKFVPVRRLAVGYVVVISLIIFFAVESPVMAYSKNVSVASQRVVGSLAIFMTMCIFLMLLPVRWLGGMNEPAPSTEEAAAIEGGFELPAKQNDSDEYLGENVGNLEGKKLSSSDPDSPAAGSPAIEDGVDRLDDALTAEPVIEKPAPLTKAESRQDPRYQGSMKDYLLTIDLWLIMLLFVFYGCLGTLVMYNASTISVAITGHARSDQLSALYTAFLGVGSAVGRIAFGMFEAYVQSQDPNNRKIVVTMALPLSPIMACIAGILILVLPGQALLFPYILVYLEEGVFAGINALIFPCLFEHYHNALYNLSFLVQCICIICFNRVMFGIFVDNKHKSLGFAASDGCNVKECVQTPIIVATCLAFCGIFVALAIHFRYARFVHRVRAEWRLERAKAVADDADLEPFSAEQMVEPEAITN